MKTILLALFAITVLCSCTNTRQGISSDSEAFGDKVQRTSEIWTQ